MGYHIVKYLESIGYEQSQQTRKKISELTSSLSKLFNVNTKSIDDFKALEYYNSDLHDILKKGVEKNGAGHFDADLAEAQSNEKFANFSAVIASRQYFEGATEGTLEHLRRRSRVLSKFREKYPKTDLTIDDPNHPLRALLAKSKISSPNANGTKFSPAKSFSPSAKLQGTEENKEEKNEGIKKEPEMEEAKKEEPKKVEAKKEEAKEEVVEAKKPNEERAKTKEPNEENAKTEEPKKEEVGLQESLPTPPSNQEKAPEPPPPPAATPAGNPGKKNKKKKGKK